MKKLFLIFAVLLTLGVNALATPVTVAASTQSNFNPSGLSGDVTGITVSVTNSSVTVTSSAAFRAAWVGLSGFRVSIGGTAYTVAYVTSTSSLTLTAAFAGATGSTTMTLYKYVEVRFYSSISFRPLGSSEVIQVGTPGSGSWFKRFAAGIVNESGVNTLYIPQFIIESTTDSVDNNTARYTIGFYRPDNSLIQYFTCSGASQLRFPPVTPTTLADVCLYNSTIVIQTNQTTYTTDQINARFPSCSSGQMLYYAATGQNQSCLTVGSGLSIAGGTITAAGGGGGVTGSGTTNYVPIWTSSSAIGASQLFYDGANSRFQSQKDILIFTTASSSKLLIDSDQVVLEGSSTRATSAHMLTMKAVASQTGQYERFLDSSSVLKYAVDADGDVYPRGVTTAWPSANAAGVLTNNGTGTLSWSTVSGTVTGTGTINYLPIWTSASALGSSQMFYDSGNSRFQSQKDVLIFTTAANSRLLIDTSVTLEGSDTRATSAHMFNLKGVASQTGDFERFLDSASTVMYRVTSAGNVHPRGVSTTWPSANAAGVLTNNGSGTLSWGASSSTNVRQAFNVKTDYGAVCDGVTNDTTAIQNAINAAVAAGGKIVYVPGGTCLVTGLSIPAEIVLVGDGDKKSIISSTTNATIISVTAASSSDFRGPTIEDIGIQGNVSAGSSQVGLKVTDASFIHSVRINRVTISNTGSYGLETGNVFSSNFSNIFIDNTNGYPLLYNSSAQPGNRFESVYVGLLRVAAPTAFRIKAGDFVCYSCNGVNNVVAGSQWMVIGKKSGVDGDVTNASATAVLHDSNLESWASTGVRLYHGSTVDLKGKTSIAGDSGTAAASKFGIYHELNQDGVDFFAQFIKRGEIDDEVDFADGVAAYNNSQPIQCNGFCPFQLNGIGPGAGGATLSTYRNVTGTQNLKISRADGRHSKTAITTTTTISQPGPSYYEVDSTGGAVTLTLEWAARHQNAQTPIIIKDTGGLAATNNITVAGGGGGTVGSGTYVINQNGGSVILMPDGDTSVGNWRIIATYPASGGASVNPTSTVMPYNNAGVFADSPLTRVSSTEVQIAASFNPSTDNTRTLGTALLHWSTAFTNRTRADGGSTALPAFTGSDTDTGINFPGLNEVEINTSGTQRLWITNGNAIFSVKPNVNIDDAVTTSVSTLLDLEHSSTGTPGVGFGGGIRFALESSTTLDQEAAQMNAAWSVATHGSRTSLVSFSVVGNTTLSEILRLQGVSSGTAVNYAQITHAATGAGPIYGVGGSDANVSINLTPKGSGLVLVTTGIAVQGGSQAANETAFLMPFTGGTNSGGPALRWGSSASYASQSSLYLSNGFTFQGASSSHDPVKIRTGTGTSSDGTTVFEFRPTDGVFNYTPSTSATSSRLELQITDVTSTGTPSAGFGGQMTYRGESSTSASQNMASFNWNWFDATHATRTSNVFVQTVYQAGSLTEVWGLTGGQNYGAAEYDNGNVSGSVTIDWNRGNHQKMRMTGNVTTLTFSNIEVGAWYVLQLIQDGTGSRSVDQPSNVIMPGGPGGGNIAGLTANVNAVDEIWCRSNGTTVTCQLVADVK